MSGLRLGIQGSGQHVGRMPDPGRFREIAQLVEGPVVYGEALNAWVGVGTAVVAAGMALASLPPPARRRPPV